MSKQLVALFLFTLLIGTVCVVGAVLGFGEKTLHYFWQLVFSLVIGVAVALGVFLNEKSIYVRLSKNITSQYKITATWRYVSLFFLVLTLIFKNEIRGMSLFAWGIYLLTLAYVLFQIRNYEQVKVA